jgi:hypothetical protein
MDIQTLQQRLEIWKRILFIVSGATFTLFLQAILNYQQSRSLIFPTSWYGVWFVLQLASFFPPFILLWGRHWMQLPLLERLNIIFGYFVVAWFTLLPVGLRTDPYSSKAFNFFWLGGAIVLAMGYRWLRRKNLGMQNEIFP